MKRIVFVAILVCGIHLFAPVSQSVDFYESHESAPLISQNLMNNQQQQGDELGDDEDYMFYEQEIFSRKLFQKKLPPLTQKEKIIWAFRMSEPDLFL